MGRREWLNMYKYTVQCAVLPSKNKEVDQLHCWRYYMYPIVLKVQSGEAQLADFGQEPWLHL